MLVLGAETIWRRDGGRVHDEDVTVPGPPRPACVPRGVHSGKKVAVACLSVLSSRATVRRSSYLATIRFGD
jgi:hypothetical protein